MNSKPLYAIWDEKRSVTIGKLVIFLEEVSLLCREEGTNDVIIAWCGNNVPPSIFEYPMFVKDILVFENFEQASEYYRSNKGNFSRAYGRETVRLPSSREESLLYVGDICNKNFLRIEPKFKYKNEALKLIGEVARSKKIVSLHLKNHPTNQMSNATFDGWDRFVGELYGENKNLFFIAIGNEKPKIKPKSNFHWTGGGSLLCDLALIDLSHAFMGMSSGLCQVAMFGIKPYVIFKHPGHHTEEMKREFCGGETFPFCNAKQRFVIAHDNHETISKHWRAIERFI